MSLGSSCLSNSSSNADCEIRQILNKKTFRGKTYYQVKCLGNEEPTWELAKNCNCPHLIDQFESETIEVDESDNEWEVQEILEKRTKKGKVEYLVRWKGWPGGPTWELAENCQCVNLIAAFENPKLKKLWDFEGSNQNLWLDRRSMLRYMRRHIRINQSKVNLLRFKPDFPPDEKAFQLLEGLNIGPICYERHWYLVIILVNHINITRKILVGDALNTLIGTNKKDHPVMKRLRNIYNRFTIQPVAFTQMDRSDVCAYYTLAAFERAIFLLNSDAPFIMDSIFFDPVRAEMIRSEVRPETNGEISVALPIPEAFDLGPVCEFCKKQFDSRRMVDKHINELHFTRIINID